MAVNYRVRLTELTPVEVETPIGVFQGLRSDILKLTWPFLGPRPDDPDNALTFEMKSAQDKPDDPYWTEAPYRLTIYMQVVQTVFGDEGWYVKIPLASTPFDIGTATPPASQPTEDEMRENFAKSVQQFSDSQYAGDFKKIGGSGFGGNTYYAASMFSGNSLFGSMFKDIPESVRNPLNITPLPGKYGAEWPWWSQMTGSDDSWFNEGIVWLFCYPYNASIYGMIGDAYWNVVEDTPGVSVNVVKLYNGVEKDNGNFYQGIITPIDKPLDFFWLNYVDYNGARPDRPFGYYWGATRIWFGIEENTQEATT